MGLARALVPSVLLLLTTDSGSHHTIPSFISIINELDVLGVRKEMR